MRVMILAPHPDDELYGPGAWALELARDGHEVFPVILAHRRVDGALIDEARQAKFEEAARHVAADLGWRSPRFYRFPDEAFGSLYDLKSVIEAEIVAFGPDLLLSPGEHDYNQDHRSVCHAARIAMRPFARPFGTAMLSWEGPSATPDFRPRFWAEVQPDSLHHVLSLAEMYYPTEMKRHPHPRSPESVWGRAVMRGGESGCSYALAFEVEYIIGERWLCQTRLS